MMKTYSSMNTTMMVTNYPLTIVYLVFAGQSWVYIAIIIFLVLNKVSLSFFGCKVR